MAWARRSASTRRISWRLVISDAVMTPIVTTEISTVQTALISGVTPNRTDE